MFYSYTIFSIGAAMTVAIGINPITWTNDDVPELGGDTPLETCLTEAREAGYAGIELGGKFPRQASELRPILAGHGLELISGWFDGRILEQEVGAEWDAVLPHLTLLRDMGCRHVVYADTSRRAENDLWGPVSRRPHPAEGDWPAYGRKLTALAELMADFGVAMAFHHHMGTIVETDAEVGLLMQHTGPAVGLLYDTGHCLFAGGDPLALVRRHVDRIVHVHCKDARPAVLERARAQDMSFMGAVVEGIFTVPGDGMVDYASILKVLADHGYEGWLVVEAEQDPKKAPPFHYAQLGCRNLTRLAAVAGFEVKSR
jgi:inosose dehydratase